MKQGSGSSRSGSQKVEPRPHAINPGGVSLLGEMQGNHADRGTFKPKITPMNAGRGFSAPAPVACTVHKGGSQGKR
jgi:hypothetical protein